MKLLAFFSDSLTYLLKNYLEKASTVGIIIFIYVYMNQNFY